MKGRILDYSVQSSTGSISGADGVRYVFDGSEWKGNTPPARGMAVDFDIDGNQAMSVFIALAGPGSSSKDKTAAGLLAIFLGGLGVHKFYLGYTGSGLVYLLTNTVGFWITWIMLWIPNVALGVMALIEGIIYLTKSDEEFEQTYVVGRKSWF